MSSPAGLGDPIGRLEDFPPRRWTMVRHGGREIGIFNTGERFYAVRNKCPHEGAPLCVQELSGTMLPSSPRRYEYGLHDRVLTCPWHGWQFDVEDGEMLFGTGARRLSTSAGRVRDGRLYILGRAAAG